MDDLALRRLRVLPLPRGSGLSPKRRLGLLAELAGLGVRLRNPERLTAADESWLAKHAELIEAITRLRGGEVDYVPLFLGFPSAVPDDDEYFARRVIGYVGNQLGLFEDGPSLEQGAVVPKWLFDLRQFGADPITQMQTLAQHEAGKAALAGRVPDGHVEWIDLELVWEDELAGRFGAWLRDRLYAKSSIEHELHDDLRTVLLRHGDAAGIDCERIVFNETKALTLEVFWRADRLEAVTALARTPTDLLRMFAALTGTDLSLASKVRFVHMRRAQRRAILAVLERSASLEQDLARYRGLWLELGRYLHPGEYADKFPRAAAGFDRLRNGKIRSFAGEIEADLAAKDLPAVLARLRTRPGSFARRLHELLRRFPSGTAATLAAFAEVVDEVPSKTLLVLRPYFATIDGAEHRTVITKLGRIKVLPNTSRGALSVELRERIDTLLRAALLRRFASKPCFAGRAVWIDPALAKHTVPLQQRAASDGTLSFARGSRIPVDFDKVLRVFVYWHQTERRTDLDLSLLGLDGDFRYVDHVSYTNLAAQGIVHSGDIQSAPHGATELIDVTLAALPKATRYLAVQIYRYCGESFAELRSCHAGWMIRERVDAQARLFDVKTVANKFDLHGRSAYAFPFFVDLHAREIVATDLYMGGRALHNNVEGAFANVATTCREIARFTETRPTMAALARLHLEARGGREVERREDAEISFGRSGCTYDAEDVGRILSELL